MYYHTNQPMRLCTVSGNKQHVQMILESMKQEYVCAFCKHEISIQQMNTIGVCEECFVMLRKD